MNFRLSKYFISSIFKIYTQKISHKRPFAMKSVDARKLVKRYYVEKQKHENKLSERPAQIKTNVHSGMSPIEKFGERFSRFLQKK